MRENLKSQITKYINEYVDEYNLEVGQYVGDVDSLASNIVYSGATAEVDTTAEAINEMIAEGVLVEDRGEIVNPSNNQHTLIINIITTNTFTPTAPTYIHIKAKNIRFSSWETYEISEFEEFKKSEIENIEYKLANSYDTEELEDKLEDFKNAQTWEDLSYYYDFLKN